MCVWFSLRAVSCAVVLLLPPLIAAYVDIAGVYLCQFSDLLQISPIEPGSTGNIIIFKVIKVHQQLEPSVIFKRSSLCYRVWDMFVLCPSGESQECAWLYVQMYRSHSQIRQPFLQELDSSDVPAGVQVFRVYSGERAVCHWRTNTDREHFTMMFIS